MNKTPLKFLLWTTILTILYKAVGPDAMIVGALALIVSFLHSIANSFKNIEDQCTDSDYIQDPNGSQIPRHPNPPPPPPRKCEDEKCSGK